jgi:[ribosomal protein S5]-alanine N-acetyltransferase
MIETQRLIIKPFTLADAEAFFELSLDKGFNLFPITRYEQKTIESAREWIKQNIESVSKNKLGFQGIWEKSSNTLIGIAGFRLFNLEKENRYEITYRLRENAWGKGYATEAARAMLEFGFKNSPASEIAVSITPDNEASIKVAKKLGFKWTNNELLMGIPAEILRISREEFGLRHSV